MKTPCTIYANKVFFKKNEMQVIITDPAPIKKTIRKYY
jgi:hypothetical protein